MSSTTEPDLATRAPESDAAEEQPQAAQQHAEQGDGTLGEHCVSDRPTPAGATSSGEIIQLDGIDTYISKPADYPHASSKLLLLLSSGTGIHSTNNQLQADAFAKEGFLVVMPDQFNKDPAPNTADVKMASEKADVSVIEKIKNVATDAAKSFLIDMWLARQTTEKVMPVLEKVIKSAKEEYADAYSSGGGLYAVGYCFGGGGVLRLASSASTTETKEAQTEEAAGTEQTPVIKAGAFAHGTLITAQDFLHVKAPVSIVAVEDDQLFPDEHRTAGKEQLEKNGVEHEIKVYAGMPHGFAVVGEYADAKIKQSQTEAFQQMLAWVKSH